MAHTGTDQETQMAPDIAPAGLMPMPAKTGLNTAPTGAMFSNNSSGGSLFSTASLSATALLQKAAQMGATSSNGTRTSSLVTSMAPPFTTTMQQQIHQNNQILNRIFTEVAVDDQSPAMNDIGMFFRFLDHQNNLSMRNLNQNNIANDKLDNNPDLINSINTSGANNNPTGFDSTFCGGHDDR